MVPPMFDEKCKLLVELIIQLLQSCYIKSVSRLIKKQLGKTELYVHDVYDVNKVTLKHQQYGLWNLE